MNDSRTCPQCGAPLAPGRADELCPKCLLGVGLRGFREADTAPPSDSIARSAARTASSATRFVPPEPEALAALFPRLEILELIGAGGMGAVYKARQQGLGRLVALKILPAEIGDDPEFAERFSREARALAHLTHRHIVSIYDFGQVEGLYFFVMEFVDGVNLRQLMEMGISTDQALAIVPQVCEALQYAHDEGVVHRDIKPENILVDTDGVVKIADFGVAKVLGGTTSDFTLTGPGHVMGTVHYMAPEQFRKAHEVDHRADIYSLGVVLYEMLTGELPIGRFGPPSKKVRIDVRLDEVVLRALEEEPKARYQRATEMKTDMASVGEGAFAELGAELDAAIDEVESAVGIMVTAGKGDRVVTKEWEFNPLSVTTIGVLACVVTFFASLIVLWELSGGVASWVGASTWDAVTCAVVSVIVGLVLVANRSKAPSEGHSLFLATAGIFAEILALRQGHYLSVELAGTLLHEVRLVLFLCVGVFFLLALMQFGGIENLVKWRDPETQSRRRRMRPLTVTALGAVTSLAACIASLVILGDRGNFESPSVWIAGRPWGASALVFAGLYFAVGGVLVAGRRSAPTVLRSLILVGGGVATLMLTWMVRQHGYTASVEPGTIGVGIVLNVCTVAYFLLAGLQLFRIEDLLEGPAPLAESGGRRRGIGRSERPLLHNAFEICTCILGMGLSFAPWISAPDFVMDTRRWMAVFYFVLCLFLATTNAIKPLPGWRGSAKMSICFVILFLDGFAMSNIEDMHPTDIVEGMVYPALPAVALILHAIYDLGRVEHEEED